MNTIATNVETKADHVDIQVFQTNKQVEQKVIKGGLARNKVIAESGQMFELNELIRVKKGALVGRVNLTTPYWVFSLRLRITSADDQKRNIVFLTISDKKGEIMGLWSDKGQLKLSYKRAGANSGGCGACFNRGIENKVKLTEKIDLRSVRQSMTRIYVYE